MCLHSPSSVLQTLANTSWCYGTKARSPKLTLTTKGPAEGTDWQPSNWLSSPFFTSQSHNRHWAAGGGQIGIKNSSIQDPRESAPSFSLHTWYSFFIPMGFLPAIKLEIIIKIYWMYTTHDVPLYRTEC